MSRLANSFLRLFVRAVLYCYPPAWRNGTVKRSLWAGTPIINVAVNARAERLLGVKANSLVYTTYFVTSDFTYNFSAWMRGRLSRMFLPYFVFLWACARYQRFHYYCDVGLLWPVQHRRFNEIELGILKRLGKQIFFWTYGADVRTRKVTESLGEYNCCMECDIPEEGCICDDSKGRSNQDLLRRYATAVFAMGDMTEYTPGSRNDLFFWPVDLDADDGRKYAPRYPSAVADRPLCVVHAPNHPRYKGTRFLLEAAERLRQEGLAVNVKLVQGVPNEEALEIYRTADVIFDQCIVGYHGYFAIEAMAMGKPVMVYVRKPEEYLLCPEECPIINARADQVEDVLRDLIANRERLREIGFRGRRYVEKYFSLEAFAQRLNRAYADLGVS